MKRALAISVIALVAVVMGMSAVAPMIPEATMIPEAEARHGFDLWPSACDTLRSIPDPYPVIEEMIEDHCNAV